MKIRLLGSTSCSRCDMIKNILTTNNVEFEYQLLSDLKDGQSEEILNRAKELGINAMPIILVNNEIKTNIQEVLQLCK